MGQASSLRAACKPDQSGGTTLYVVRHGDRFDYERPEYWKTTCDKVGGEVRDPPLSALGHRQARETALELMRLTRGHVDVVLVSPYLRVIQTAQPFAHASGAVLNVEEGLAETGHVPNSIPPPAQRFSYLPELSLDYVPVHTIHATSKDPRTGRPNENYPIDYFRRMRKMAAAIERLYPGQTVVCFSHAASVALVAALTGVGIVDVGRFAPCGIYKVVCPAGGAWKVERSGADNTAYVSENSPSTYPWGFEHSRFAVHQQWEEGMAEPLEQP